MPTTVQIDGVGEVEFPDSMSPDQITETIRTKILVPKTETKTEQPAKPKERSLLETIGAGLSPLGVAPTPDVGRGLTQEVTKPVKELPKPSWQEFKAATGLSDNASQNLAAFVNNISTPTVEFMESPAGAMTAGMGAVPGAGALVGGLFSAKAIASAPEDWKRVGELWDKAHSPNATPEDKMALKNAIAQAGANGLVATAGSIPGARDLTGKLTPKAVQLANALKEEVAKAELPDVKTPEPKVESGQPSKASDEGKAIAQRGAEAAQLPGGAAELAAQDVPRAVGDLPKITPATAIGGARVEGLEAELGELHKQLQAAKISGDGEMVQEIRGRMTGISRELLGLRNVGLENLEGGLPTQAQLGTFETKGKGRGSSKVTYGNRPSGEALPEANQTPSTPISQPPPEAINKTPVTEPGTTTQQTAAEIPLSEKDLADTTAELRQQFGGEEAPAPKSKPIEPPSKEGLSVGPGAASTAEMTGPPIAEANIADQNTPPPARASVPWHQAITDVFKSAGTTLKAMAGETMPRTTALDRETGEAGARYLSSTIASEPLAKDFAIHTLEGTGVDPVKFGAALVEDNLRSIRDEFRARATEELANGNQKESDKLFAKAEEVKSLIGSEKFPFKTEDEFQDYLAEPSTKRAIENHIQQWNEIVEPQYKQARMLDPDLELPSRGLQTGARVNLKSVQPGEEAIGVGVAPQSSNLTGTMRRKTPFGIQAKGTGNVYEISYPELIANTFRKQLEIANKNAFDESLVKSGNAVIESPGWKGTVGGEQAKAFPLTRGKWQGKNIFVKKSIADEYAAASNVAASRNLGKITSVANAMNSAALKSLTEFSVHTGNLMTALFNSPVSGSLWRDYVFSALGRSDIPIQLFRAFKKAGQDNQSQLAELAKIGALRPSGSTGLGGRMIHTMDTTVRLVLDDTYKALADQGVLPKTETARREFVNQVGQYNKRAQGPIVRALRESGVGPFATAGRTFGTMAVRMATATPVVKGASAVSQGMLRASILSKWIGGLSVLATINYMTTGNVGGRKGTPVGFIDTGLDGKDGKPQIFPFFDVIGLGRAMRVSGASGVLNSQRLGLTMGDSANAAARDIINSVAGVAMGPAARAVSVAATGRAPAMQVQRVSPVVQPGKNQTVANVQEAAEDLNPLVKSALSIARGKTVGEALSQQLPRFTLRSGKPSDLSEKYPQIVRMAQVREFANDVVARTRQEPKDKRWDYAMKRIEGMPPDEQRFVIAELTKRKVFQ